MAKTRKDYEGNIRQRPDGRWEVRVTLGNDFAAGESKRISRYASSQDEAVKLLHELSFLRDTVPKSFQSIKLGEWLTFCLEVYMKPSIKQSTYSSYEAYIRVHLKPYLGELDLKDLSPRTLQQFYNYKSEAEGLSPKTIININLFLHKALAYAVTEGYISSNPAAGVNLPRGKKPQIQILTRDEQARSMQCSYQHRYGVFVRLVLFTGLRLGELLGLRWEDVDAASGVLHVRRTLNRLKKVNQPIHAGEAATEIVIQEPKTQNSIRAIPLLPAVLQDLQNWQRVQQQDAALAKERYCPSGFIVTNPYGGIIEPRTFKDYYNQILQLSGLQHFTFHALRHTFASRAMEQGMDPKTLSVMMGHYSVSFTLDTYAHVLNGHKQEAVALLEDLFTAQPVQPQNFAYPLIITTQEDGLLFELPDFPEIRLENADMAEGIALVKEQVQEAILTMPQPPVATVMSAEVLLPNQLLLQIVF